jgi:DNA polymerase-3 subunit delta'
LIGIDAVRGLINSAQLRPYEGRMRVFIIQGADVLSVDAANALLKVLEEPPPDVLILLLTDNPAGVLPTVKSRCQTVAMRPLPEGQVEELLQAEHGVGAEQAHVTARLSRGCLGWAIEASRDPAVLAGVHQRTEKIADVVESGLEVRLAYADDLARRFQRDRAPAREELFLWLRWLRDLLLIQQGQNNTVANVSWQDTLERQARALTPHQTVRWLNQITETLEYLDRNANGRLVLDMLMLESPRLEVAGTPSPLA